MDSTQTFISNHLCVLSDLQNTLSANSCKVSYPFQSSTCTKSPHRYSTFNHLRCSTGHHSFKIRLLSTSIQSITHLESSRSILSVFKPLDLKRTFLQSRSQTLPQPSSSFISTLWWFSLAGAASVLFMTNSFCFRFTKMFHLSLRICCYTVQV